MVDKLGRCVKNMYQVYFVPGKFITTFVLRTQRLVTSFRESQSGILNSNVNVYSILCIYISM